ncbi:MAG TPA: molybdopterin-dependent oxidoreductase, partial [Dehalococcoidales bacterium]|nr:molybdopterin-dependent oxidoreductase [Dehalococcoidales bacterium]
MKDKEKEKGEVSRRDFLVAAGAIVAGGAIGAGITYPLMAGKTETVEVTKTVETTKTVQVPTTITSTEPGTTVTSTAPGTTITSTAPGTTVTVTGPPPVEIKETKYSLCPGCFYSCTMEFTLVNGVVTEMRGNRDLPIMGEAGGVCGKGLAAFDRVYNPSRLLYPLKRVGKRGEGKHRRITWDEALTEIAGKLKKYRDDGHPEYAAFAYGCPRQVRARDIFVWVAKKYGTPYSVLRWHGQACNTSGSMAQTMTGNTLLGGTPDYENAKSGILFAHEDSHGRPGIPQVSVLIPKGIRKEYKCYLVDPRMGTDSVLGNNEWIPIKPNTDVALWLALLNVIIKEQMYDEERLINYSNAPCLVRDDNHLLLKNSEGEELAWDTVSDSAQPVDKEGVVPALIGARTVDGVSCKTAFDLLTERTEKYPPALAAEICEMPFGGDKIIEMARHMGNARPAVMTNCYVPGSNNFNGSIQSWRCSWLLCMLLGNKDRKGGLLGMKGSSSLGSTPPDWKAYPRPKTLAGGAIEGWDVPVVGWDADLYPLADSNQIRYSAIHKAVTQGDPHPIKMLLTSAANFFVTSRNLMEDIYNGLELLVSNDTNPVEATDWADIVLPDCTTYEMLY